MSAALKLFAELGHERLILLQDPGVGLKAVISIHDTTLGPAIGGTRMRLYPTFEDAVEDALRLSRAMTSKATFAGMACGGGKAVIFGDPAREKTPELLTAYARAVEELDGKFNTGCDMGITITDLAIMARVTRHVGHTPSSSRYDASDLTAIGVVAAMRAVCARLGKPLSDCTIALQGVGEVGGRLAARLAGEGARLVLADALSERAEAVARATGARQIGADDILVLPCDLFSPNAGGGAISESVAAALPCRAVVGAANNPLASNRAGEILAERGILYAPDYVANAGGLLSVLFEQGHLDEDGVVRRVERIGADLSALFDEAEATGTPPFQLAAERVAQKLSAARAAAAERHP